MTTLFAAFWLVKAENTPGAAACRRMQSGAGQPLGVRRAALGRAIGPAPVSERQCMEATPVQGRGLPCGRAPDQRSSQPWPRASSAQPRDHGGRPSGPPSPGAQPGHGWSPRCATPRPRAARRPRRCVAGGRAGRPPGRTRPARGGAPLVRAAGGRRAARPPPPAMFSAAAGVAPALRQPGPSRAALRQLVHQRHPGRLRQLPQQLGQFVDEQAIQAGGQVGTEASIAVGPVGAGGVIGHRRPYPCR
jgi:hypothetical protein